MAKYPDPRSASIPALHAVQEWHGWCSPTAIEQAACVMRLTPAYLTAVATFYDMFDTVPTGEQPSTCARTSRARCAGPTTVYAAMLEAAGGDPRFNVRGFECLGACDIAPMASVNGEYVGPLDDRRLQDDRGRPAGRAARSCRTSSCASARSPRRCRWRSRIVKLFFEGLDVPGLNTLEGYEQAGGYKSAEARR